MAKKDRIDGISLAIVILNICIVGVIITLVTLIYLYMTGKLEDTDVANMGREAENTASISTTPLSTLTPEEDVLSSETDTTTTTDEELIISDDEESNEIEALALDEYDRSYFDNDLFIGDSIYTGLYAYTIGDKVLIEKSHVFAQVGLNPESARTKSFDGYTAVSKAKELKPKRIFVMLGSNGLAYMSDTGMTENMKYLTEDLRAACPDSYIYIVSIPPVTKAHDAEGQETMAMVKNYNKQLKLMADETKVAYLDLCTELTDDEGFFDEDFAEADGMHFKLSAYKRMLSYFQRSTQS